MKLSLPLILSSLCFTSPFAGHADDVKVREQIEQAEQKWIAAFNKHDGDALADLYTSDAQSFQPDLGILKGQDAIRRHLKESAKDEGSLAQTVQTLDVYPAGNVATETGTWKVQSNTSSEVEEGTYAMVWQKSGDSWKVLREIWNSTHKKTPLIESLRPLERLIGNWVSELATPKGKVRVTYNAKATGGGSALLTEAKFYLDGKLADEWTELMYYDAEAKAIRDLSGSKSGGSQSSIVTVAGDRLIFQEHGVEEGEPYIQASELVFKQDKIRYTQITGFKGHNLRTDLIKDVEIRRVE